MPGESGGRLTVTVGRRELEDLNDAWAAYLKATRNVEAVDPVVAMQRTGSVLRTLDRLVSSMASGPLRPGSREEETPQSPQPGVKG